MIKELELDILGDSNFFPSEFVQYHRDFTILGLSQKYMLVGLKVVKPTQTLPFIGFG